MFDDSRFEPKITMTDTSPSILNFEVKHSIKQSKTRESCGPDEIHAETLKQLDESNVTKIKNLFNHIYTSGNIPIDWLKSIFIPIPKKTHSRKCEDY